MAECETVYAHPIMTDIPAINLGKVKMRRTEADGGRQPYSVHSSARSASGPWAGKTSGQTYAASRVRCSIMTDCTCSIQFGDPASEAF